MEGKGSASSLRNRERAGRRSGNGKEVRGVRALNSSPLERDGRGGQSERGDGGRADDRNRKADSSLAEGNMARKSQVGRVGESNRAAGLSSGEEGGEQGFGDETTNSPTRCNIKSEQVYFST